MNLIKLIEQILQSNSRGDLTTARSCIKNLKIFPHYPIILIGGTNGKGSVSNYISNILTTAGFKTGCFTSPHVFRYNERITINNQAINDEDLIKHLNIIITNLQQSNLPQLGLFQLFTLACHQYFIENNIDIAVIEVGIGGKLDITNLFEPTVSGITSISLDHMDILGHNIEEIALQKAYIYRSQKPAFFGGNNPPQAMIDFCKQNNINLQYFEQDFKIHRNELSFDVILRNKTYYAIPYPLQRSELQPINIALSIAILDSISSKFPVTTSQIKTGILKTNLIGRFQLLPGLPQIILDVAHNLEAVTAMLSNMIKLPFVRQKYAVFGIAADKDIIAIIKSAAHYFDKWFIGKINNERSRDTESIKQILLDNKVHSSNIFEFDNIDNACEHAYKQLNKQDRMVCFGSFLVVESCYNKIQELRK